jgi:hypothetical protein
VGSMIGSPGPENLSTLGHYEHRPVRTGRGQEPGLLARLFEALKKRHSKKNDDDEDHSG